MDLQRAFQNVAEWLGEEGDKFRRNGFNGGRSISEQFKADWAVFLANNREREVPDVIKELGVRQPRFEEASASGRFQSNRNRKRRRICETSGAGNPESQQAGNPTIDRAPG